MKPTLRKYVPLPLIAAAMLAAGCSDDNDNVAGDIIISATMDPGNASEGRPIINGTYIAITAFNRRQQGEPGVLMDNVVAQRLDNAWSYSPAVAWPADEVDFYAYSPIDHVAPMISPSSQRMEVESNGTTDLIFASLKGVKRTSGAINLNFRHAMARVEVDFRCVDPDILAYVSKITMKGVATQGTFTWPSGSTGIGSPFFPGKWEVGSPSESSSAIVINSPQPEPEPLGEEPMNLNSESAYFFIPQPLAADAVVEVELQLRHRSTNAIIWPEGAVSQADFGTATVPLVAKGVDSWKEASAYRYTVTVGTLSGANPEIRDVMVGVSDF